MEKRFQCGGGELIALSLIAALIIVLAMPLVPARAHNYQGAIPASNEMMIATNSP